ncbi:MAG: caspase family protein, partial [Candidatus Marsarchaeota archaeon]|nr:caspase family protein [Candidatus Marsarchaeota archaeon]
MRTKLSRNAFACVLAGIILLAAPMAAQAKKVALIIGIAHYQNMRDPGDTTSDLPIGGLRGPKNDALAIRRVIIQRYGFKPENVRILLNEQATKANVLHALNNWLVQKVDKDDVVLLYISGHGTQVLSHGLDPNRLWCQAFVCYDYAPVNSAANAPLDKRNIIINKDFEKVLNKISEKTNNITFIADCCYSGGLTRDAFPGLYGSRWLPPATVDVKRAKEAPNAPAVMDENDEANDNVTLIGACADLEQASEVQMKDGLWHGVMSYYLTKTLAQTPSNLSYGELMGIVKQDVQSKFRQTPQLITIHSDWPVLGGLSSPAAETVAATTTTTTTTTTIVSHPTASVQATAPSTTFSATATTIPSPRSDVLYVRVLSSRRSAGGLTSIINGFQNIKCTQNAGMADRIIALTRREGKVQADLTFRDGAVDATVEGASPKQIAESLRPFLQKAWLIKMVSSIRSS